MPRKARILSKTKVYHVILRGNDKQDLFYDNQDYHKFITELITTKEKYGYEIYSYCLMPNHIHLLIYDLKDNLSKSMQSLELKYYNYFNNKYEKIGHLFQNRFLSKSVENKEYLINVCRYIHLNPVKAGISVLEQYKWSSYKEYIYNSKIINAKLILSLFGECDKQAKENFIKYHINKQEYINDDFEFEIMSNLTDKQAKEKIEKFLEIKNAMEIKQLDKKERDSIIIKLTEIKGLKYNQLARITGISVKLISRILNKKEERGYKINR